MTNPNKDLIYAAICGDINGIKTALAKGANINGRDGWGTPLHWAIFNGRTEAVVFLLDQNANYGEITGKAFRNDYSHKTSIELAKKLGEVTWVDTLKLLPFHLLTQGHPAVNLLGVMHLKKAYIDIETELNSKIKSDEKNQKKNLSSYGEKDSKNYNTSIFSNPNPNPNPNASANTGTTSNVEGPKKTSTAPVAKSKL